MALTWTNDGNAAVPMYGILVQPGQTIKLAENDPLASSGSSGSGGSTPVVWESGKRYPKNQQVINADGDLYIAKIAALSSSENEPGGSGDWQDTWTAAVFGMTADQQAAMNVNTDLAADHAVADKPWVTSQVPSELGLLDIIPTLRTNVQGAVLRMALLEGHVAGDIADGFFDVFQDESMIDAQASLGIIYDSEGKFVKTDDNLVATSDPETTADFWQPDLKGTAAYFQRTSSGKGRFKTGSGGSVVTVGAGQTNPNIIPGVLINDLRTLVYIDGDGSASDSVWLDADMASGVVNSIHGLTIVDGKIQPNQVILADGATNPNTINIIPLQTGTGQATAFSETGTYASPAWKAADHDTATGWFPGTESSLPGWWMFDFGHNAFFNKFRWACAPWNQLSEPMRWYVECQADGSSEWVKVFNDYELADGPLPPQGTFTDWFSFTNSSGYRKFRMTAIGEGRNFDLGEVEIAACASVTYPSSALAIAAGDSILNIEAWSAITAVGGHPIAITETLNGDSTTFYASCMNYGADDEEWFAPGSGIARLNSGVWEYVTEDGATWASAPENNRDSALTAGLSVAIIQTNSTRSAWIASTNDDWNGLTGDSFVWAVLMQTNENDLPQFDKMVISYSAGNAVFVSKAFDLTATPGKAVLSILAKGITESNPMAVYANAGALGNTSFQECINLTKVADDIGGSGIHQYVSEEKALSGPQTAAMKVKVAMKYSVGHELHGIEGMYR